MGDALKILLAGVICAALLISGSIGYISNITKLWGRREAALTTLAALRVAGVIVPPVGIILGYVED